MMPLPVSPVVKDTTNVGYDVRSLLNSFCGSCLPLDSALASQALYAYNAEDPEELTIAEGDYLTIEDEDDEGWCVSVPCPLSSSCAQTRPSCFPQVLRPRRAG